jgi:uncharacterized protein (DUF488 family)
MQSKIYTVGHSTYPLAQFIALLRQHRISAICDVRSSPYSRYNPQFNRETLRDELKKQGVSYVYLGKELGPRSDDPKCYEEGRVRYDRLAKTALFQQGITRLKEGMKSFQIALMCAEKDPIVCHRTILVCRSLEKEGITIAHILKDGSVEAHGDTMNRLREFLKLPEYDMFTPAEQMNQRAYDLQGQKIAYVKTEEDGGAG